MNFPSAILTNSITNGLHALFLLSYFLLSVYQYAKKTPTIHSVLIVLFFFFVFVEKILGVVVHYFIDTLSPEVFNGLWIAISVGTVCLDYCLLYGLAMPNAVRRVGLAIAILLNTVFIVRAMEGNIEFLTIALSLILVFIMAAYYSKGLTRTAFLCVIVSNVIWIALRMVISFYWINLQENVAYTYDNDLYHLMLVVSTYLLYLSLVRGDWTYPEKQNVF